MIKIKKSLLRYASKNEYFYVYICMYIYVCTYIYIHIYLLFLICSQTLCVRVMYLCVCVTCVCVHRVHRVLFCAARCDRHQKKMTDGVQISPAGKVTFKNKKKKRPHFCVKSILFNAKLKSGDF